MTNKKNRHTGGVNESTQYYHTLIDGVPSIPPEGIKFRALNPITGRHVVVGTLYPTGVFCKAVAEKSRLKVLDAFGIEANVIDQLETYDCKEIRLTVRDSGETYAVDFATFYSKAVRRSFGRSSYQCYLPLSYWQKLGGPEQISLVRWFDGRQNA